MKKLVGICLLALAGNVAAEQTSFVNADASIYSELCIAAVTSAEMLDKKAAEFKFSKEDLKKFSCNGMELDDFVKKYGPDSGSKDKDIKVFAFEKSMQNTESDICVAAATSNEAFAAIKAKVGRSDDYFKEIHCNDIPLVRFARKFGNKDFKLGK